MGSWRDHADQPAAVPEIPGAGAEAFYIPIGEFQGAEYRRPSELAIPGHRKP